MILRYILFINQASARFQGSWNNPCGWKLYDL